MAEDDSERSEEATDMRRDEFRKRGQVANTKELASCIFLLASAACVLVLSQFFFKQVYQIFQFLMGDNMVEITRGGTFHDAFIFAGTKMAVLILPILAISAVISVLSSVLQTGWLQIEDALSPDLERINPLKGLGRVFSLKAVVEALKSIIKIIFIGTIVYLILKKEIYQVPYLVQYNVEQIVSYLGGLVFKLFMTIGLVIGVLAIADYFFQRWDLEKQMMMTKQEVKEENKSREGDPMIKARIRKIQRDVANRRMMQKVPKGDVVITNPTHIAVVLKYDANLPAPQVIAKGADHVAEKIKQIARENGIPIVENIPLARTIFKTLKIGQVIPRELFVAVAEVLAYVFKLKRKVKR